MEVKPMIDVGGRKNTLTMVAERGDAIAPEIKEAPAANLPMVIQPLQVQCLEGKKIVDIIPIQPEHDKQAHAVADSFNFYDTNAVLVFGAAPQQKYLANLKTLLGDAKIGDLYGAGDIVMEMEKGIKMINIDKMKKEISRGPGFIGKIFGGMLASVKSFMAKREELIELIGKIEKDTDDKMHKIMLDNARLDVMYMDVESNFYELGVWVCAGEYAMERGGVEFEALRQEAVASGDPVRISKANLFREQLVAMDTRLLRMKTAYVKAPVTMQKILTTQQVGRIEVQNLMESLLFDLPALVEALNTLLALYNIKGAQENREKREKMRERIEQLEGNVLEEAAVKAKEGQIRGAREVQLVEMAANKIVSTCKKLREMDAKNLEVRRQAETQLVTVMETFKEGMKEITLPDKIV